MSKLNYIKPTLWPQNIHFSNKLIKCYFLVIQTIVQVCFPPSKCKHLLILYGLLGSWQIGFICSGHERLQRVSVLFWKFSPCAQEQFLGFGTSSQNNFFILWCEINSVPSSRTQEEIIMGTMTYSPASFCCLSIASLVKPLIIFGFPTPSINTG